jgi:hypothetical protein
MSGVGERHCANGAARLTWVARLNSPGPRNASVPNCPVGVYTAPELTSATEPAGMVVAVAAKAHW